MLTVYLILLPMLTAILAAVTDKKMSRWIALGGSLLSLLLTCYMLSQFHPDEGRQFQYAKPWIPQFGASFKVGMDGISMLMVLLTNLLMPILFLSTFRKGDSKPSALYALMSLMHSALIGVFVSQDAFLYYIFWELSLIPIYFIVLLWGGENRLKITVKFFVYTLAGSLFMLAGLLFLYYNNPGRTFDIDELYRLQLSADQQSIVFWLLFVAYAIKIPIFPLHTWQAATYTTAPAEGSMLLSGIMLKMGIYSVVRWVFPIVPIGAYMWSDVVLSASIIGVVYGSWIAIRQQNLKTLLAYSSFAHVGLIVAGLFSFRQQGLQGAMFQSFSHGINVVGLFFAAEIISRRLHTHDLQFMGGIRKNAPVFTSLFLILLFGSIALPLTNGFVGEFMILQSISEYRLWIAGVAGLSVILGAVYMLTAFQKSVLGENREGFEFSDLEWSEWLTLAPLALIVIVTGVFPQYLLSISGPAIARQSEIFSVFLSLSGK